MNRSRRFGVLVAVLAAVMPFIAIGSPATASTATITLNPKAGPPTTRVTVTGSGFGATETVKITFANKGVASSTTTSAGTFTARFRVPASAQPGGHTVTAKGQTSGSTASAPFLVQADWPQFRYGPAHTGYNPFENVLTFANSYQLGKAWTGATGNAVYSSPAVANGMVYVGSADGKLYAFDASATTACANTLCTPLWTAAMSGAAGNPAVADGVVYIDSGDGRLYAFDAAAGSSHCSGTPKTCAPLWTASTGGSLGSPTVANGVVYAGSADNSLYAFDASGGSGHCSVTPKPPTIETCTPLWLGPTGGAVYSSPAVADGVVYVGSDDGNLYAFDAAGGGSHCSAAMICSPLWTAAGTEGFGISSSPAVANGVVYVGAGESLYAFDASGASTHCTGTPTTCTPLWIGPTAGRIYASPAVAYGAVYVPSQGDGRLYVFDASGGSAHCTGAPMVCTPLWTAGFGDGGGPLGYSSPAVANGVVYVGGNDHYLYVFDAKQCFNSTSCFPQNWRGIVGVPGQTIISSPAVADGVVYVGSLDFNLYAFRLGGGAPPTGQQP